MRSSEVKSSLSGVERGEVSSVPRCFVSHKISHPTPIVLPACDICKFVLNSGDRSLLSI